MQKARRDLKEDPSTKILTLKILQTWGVYYLSWDTTTRADFSAINTPTSRHKITTPHCLETQNPSLKSELTSPFPRTLFPSKFHPFFPPRFFRRRPPTECHVKPKKSASPFLFPPPPRSDSMLDGDGTIFPIIRRFPFPNKIFLQTSAASEEEREIKGRRQSGVSAEFFKLCSCRNMKLIKNSSPACFSGNFSYIFGEPQMLFGGFCPGRCVLQKSGGGEAGRAWKRFLVGLAAASQCETSYLN